MRSPSPGVIIGPQRVSGRAGSPVRERGRGRRQGLAELGRDGLVDEHALHRDARLAGVGVRSARDPPRDGLEVAGVGFNDHRRVAAQLERDPAVPELPLEAPADGRRPGEGHQAHPRVVEQRRGLGPAARHHVDPPGRHAGLVEDPAEQQRRGRRLRRRLEDDRATGRDRGAELVRHQVEGEVERRDPDHDADREPAQQRGAPRPGREAPEVDQLAVRGSGDPGRVGERFGAAFRLDAGEGERLPRLLDHRLAASSSRRRATSPAALSRIVARSCGASAAIAGRAVAAASSAAARWALPARATRATSRPSYGERTVRTPSPCCQAPATNNPSSLMAASGRCHPTAGRGVEARPKNERGAASPPVSGPNPANAGWRLPSIRCNTVPAPALPPWAGPART